MKKTLLTLSVTVASAFMMYGQAYVRFNNTLTYPTNAITIWNCCPSQQIFGIGYEYSVQLLWVPGTIRDQYAFDAANPAASAAFSGSDVFFAPTGPLSTGGGFFNAGIVALSGPPGTYTMQVRAWYSVGYPTYAAALAAGVNFGQSVLFTVNATAPPSNATDTVFPGFMVGVRLDCLPQYIIVQPQSQSVYVGDNVTFSVTAGFARDYQWRKNVSAIGGATQSSYTLTSVTTNDAGNYDVVVSGSCPAVTSAVAVLQVLPGKPLILVPPLSQTAEVGSTVELLVVAAGAWPLVYQWFFSDTNAIPGPTDSMLELTNVQLSQSGAYSVVITNSHGLVTSSPAMLSVIPVVERRMVPGLTLMGQPGNALNLDVTDNLVPSPNWAAFDSVLLTNPAQWYFDLTTSLPAQRFFRAWQAGGQAVPALDAHLIPALTLTGPVGSDVRVDGINRIGPTDAWFPLATVTLTNTSQLYFDVSIIGQPARLYRLVQVP